MCTSIEFSLRTTVDSKFVEKCVEGSIDDSIRCHVHEPISGAQLSIQPTDICRINYISVNAPSD